jgi:hypothetical protein
MRKVIKMRKWIVFGFLVTASNFVSAAEYTTVSKDGKNLTFTISNESISRSTTQGTLCSDLDATFKKFKLWMTVHNHGSTSTKLSATSSKCATVEKINFVMSGTWDIKIEMEDEDSAVLSVNIP